METEVRPGVQSSLPRALDEVCLLRPSIISLNQHSFVNCFVEQFAVLSRVFTKLELADGDYVSPEDVRSSFPAFTEMCLVALQMSLNFLLTHCEFTQNWAYSQTFAQLCHDPVPSLVMYQVYASLNVTHTSI